MEVNKIYNADCLEVLKNIDTESVDLVVTDCPYKLISGGVRTLIMDENGNVINKDYTKASPSGCLARGRKTIYLGENKTIEEWIEKNGNIPYAVSNGKMFEFNEIKFEEWLPEIYRVLKKGTHCYIMINGRNLKELQQKAEDAGFAYQNLLIWDKGNSTPNRYYLNATEFVLFLSKRPAKNINNMGTSNILRIRNIIGNKKHPTEKPIPLLDVMIKNSSQKGDIVLDPFCGVGSTCMAAKNLERKYIGIEIDPKYHAIAQDRINNEEMLYNNLFDN